MLFPPDLSATCCSFAQLCHLKPSILSLGLPLVPPSMLFCLLRHFCHQCPRAWWSTSPRHLGSLCQVFSLFYCPDFHHRHCRKRWQFFSYSVGYLVLRVTEMRGERSNDGRELGRPAGLYKKTFYNLHTCIHHPMDVKQTFSFCILFVWIFKDIRKRKVNI